MIRKILIFCALIIQISCSQNHSESGKPVITVSIAPYKYFIDQIAGNDFEVNVMVAPGSNPHIYEPYPVQVAKLRKSVAYISNGYLGFETTWLDRFYEMNEKMVRLSLADKIEPIASSHHHSDNEDVEGADPHYWVSPKAALIIAESVEKLLVSLNPDRKNFYSANLSVLNDKINRTDSLATELFSKLKNKAFMIYHPNLAYLARDYGLREIPVEFEGKEPPPSRMKELIDLAKKENINTIFVQKEYDAKNARAIASEINAQVEIIDPLAEDWQQAVNEIITSVYKSMQ